MIKAQEARMLSKHGTKVRFDEAMNRIEAQIKEACLDGRTSILMSWLQPDLVNEVVSELLTGGYYAKYDNQDETLEVHWKNY